MACRVSWVLLALLGLVTAAFGQSVDHHAKSLPVDSATLKKITVQLVSMTNYSDAPGANDLVKNYSITLRNNTPYELASVTLKFRIKGDHGHTTIYTDTLPPVTNFLDQLTEIAGGALPYSFPRIATVVVQYPGSYWRTDTIDTFEVVAATHFVGAPSLRYDSHVYTLFRTASQATIKTQVSMFSTCFDRRKPAGAAMVAIAYAAANLDTLKWFGQPGDGRCLTRQRDTIMHMAATNASPGVLDLALKYGAPVDSNGQFGGPLNYAIFSQKAANVKWLLGHGANPNRLNSSRETPLMIAAVQGSVPILKSLLKAGANLHLHDPYGYSALHHVAQSGGEIAMVEFLVHAGISVNDRVPGIGITPIMAAARTQQSGVIKWLAKHGARLDLKDASGFDAFAYARSGNTLHTDEFFRADLRAAGGKLR